MRHISPYTLFRLNEARFSLSPGLRDLVSKVDSGISARLLSLEGGQDGQDLGHIDVGTEPNTLTVKAGKHPPRQVTIGKIVNKVMPGEFSSRELEDFVFHLRQKSTSTPSREPSAEDHMTNLTLHDHNQTYPNNFSNALIRGARMGKQKHYIDWPSSREVSIGQSTDENYSHFMALIAKTMSQDPRRSVHMLVCKDRVSINTVRNYGDPYSCRPKVGARFSFSTETRNGGLGSTWFFATRIVDENMDRIGDLSRALGTRADQDTIEEIASLRDIDIDTDIKEFDRIAMAYLGWLVDIGVIGDMSYEELQAECASGGSRALQVWTESEVLHVLV